MHDFLVDTVNWFNWFVIFYFLALNSFYLALVLIASRTTRRTTRMPPDTALEDLFANPLTPGVSVLVPAYNEEKSIVSSVHAVLALRYPLMEIVIAEDGSTDNTFDVLRDEFDLIPSNRVPAGTRLLGTRSNASCRAAKVSSVEPSSAITTSISGYRRASTACTLETMLFSSL